MFDLKKLELADKGAIRAFAGFFPPGVCEFSFANLVLWQDFDRPQFAVVDGCLCIRIDPVDEPPFFLQPLGRGDRRRVAAACLEHTGKISRLTPEFLPQVPTDRLRVRLLPDHYDYLYRVRDLAEMKGRRFDGKRNHIKRMIARYPGYRVERLTPAHRDEALAIFDAWTEAKKAGGGEAAAWPELAYSSQRDGIERVFAAYDELDIIGGALLLGGRLAGFILGSEHSPEAACVHFCYTQPEIAGAFPTLLWEACRTVFAHFACVNLEQDLGVLGLRKFKRSFHPTVIAEKYEVEAGA